jgi:osmoprotectant transport system substrate-binding protein
MRFTEDIILGYMALESLRANTDLTVLNEMGLGGSAMNFRAVKNGEATLFWFYTGGAWATIPPKKTRDFPDPKKLYLAVKQKMKRHYGLVYLNRAPFNNTYTIIADPKWTKRTGVKTLRDLSNYINAGNTDIKVVLSPEFRNRDDGWPGLVKTYNFADTANQLDIRTVSPSLTYQVVAQTGADIGMGFSTNPKIRKYGLGILDDTKGFFLIYNPAPLVNGKALDANPSMREPLNAIGPTITTEEIRRLNGLVALQNRDPQDVAHQYLRSEGLL